MLRSFRARLTILFGLLVLGVTTVLSLVLGSLTYGYIARDRGEALQELARATGNMLAEGLHERSREIELLAESPELQRSDLDSRMWRVALDRIKRTRPQYAWIGIVDERGIVRSATGGLLIGESVAGRPWFENARGEPFTGDVHLAKLLAPLMARPSDAEPLRFIDFSAPLRNERGDPVGVLGAHAEWEWAEDVVSRVRHDDIRERGVAVFILDRKGAVIYHPRELSDGVGLASGEYLPMTHDVAHWNDGKRCLTASAPVAARSPATDLGWTVVVRQPTEYAMVAVESARRVVLVSGVIASSLAMLLAWLMAARFGKPLTAISKAARRIEGGELDAVIPTQVGTTELSELGTALEGMTKRLVDRERALAHVNEELEARVRERTGELERANAELDALARKDALTGAFNRRAADERLHEEMARHGRSGEAMAVVMVDIDHFKRINDAHGHAVGDDVLRAVVESILRTCRRSDFVARFGGEEFMILLPDTDRDAAAVAAEKMRRAISLVPIAPVGRVTASFGVADSVGAAVAIDALLARADEALYAAKAGGRDRVMMTAHSGSMAPTDSARDAAVGASSDRISGPLRKIVSDSRSGRSAARYDRCDAVSTTASTAASNASAEVSTTALARS